MSDGAPSDEVLYDSPRTPLVWKLIVSVGTGFALVAFMSFLRWSLREPDALRPPISAVALALAVSLVMAASAWRSRITRRVEVRDDDLLLYRDPGRVERVTLRRIAAVRCEPASGGWSRDPADILVLSRDDGTTSRYELPDDADTPGIVRDVVTRLEALRARA